MYEKEIDIDAEIKHRELVRVIVSELDARYERVPLPLYPRVLVRVLPKTQLSPGGVIVPELEQNKPVHEAVVIETWQPHECPMPDGNGDTYMRRSDLKTGDHILFHHMHGVPAGYMDRDDYRFVDEREVYAVLRYENPVTPQDIITKAVADCECDSQEDFEDFVAEAGFVLTRLAEYFHLVPKLRPRTTSGV